MAEPAVTAIIVNHNTSALALASAATLEDQEVSLTAGVEGVETVIVDNASRDVERELLRASGRAVIFNDRNVGYGAALNQGAGRARAPMVLFSNSDTLYRPGALQAMAAELHTRPRCGGAGPRLTWDEAGELLIPPGDTVTPWTAPIAAACGRVPPLASAAQKRWVRRALAFWRAKEPIPWPMLSGASIMTTRDVLARVGTFDERFHLYYEDTDWCRRVVAAGLELRYVPAAGVVHFYNQSAKLVAGSAATVERSAAAYHEKHHGRLSNAAAGRVAAIVGSGPSTPAGEVDLGRRVDAPVLSAQVTGPSLVLLSPNPGCVPGAAAFRTDADFRLPADVWNRVAPGVLHGMLLALPDLRVVRRWRWEKVSSADETLEPVVRGGVDGRRPPHAT